jgi:hypothetical protein
MTPAQQTAADKALEDRDRLYRRYRVIKKAEFERLCADPIWGERLRKFVVTLKDFGADDADRMIMFVQYQGDMWLRSAPDDIRFAALQAIDRRIIRIRQRAGLAPFDDALPGEEDDVFQICKKALAP